jgi:hypothetical protein
LNPLTGFPLGRGDVGIDPAHNGKVEPRNTGEVHNRADIEIPSEDDE